MYWYRSWNLHEASLRAAEAKSQKALLSSHEAQLQNLSLVMQSGHASILERIETTRSLASNVPSPSTSALSQLRQGHPPRGRTKSASARTLRIALPRWLAHRVWEFALRELDGTWNLSVRPINVRRWGTFAFDVVRSGNVEAVKRLLTSGELSVSDYEHHTFDNTHKSMLCVSSQMS